MTEPSPTPASNLARSRSRREPSIQAARNNFANLFRSAEVARSIYINICGQPSSRVAAGRGRKYRESREIDVRQTRYASLLVGGSTRRTCASTNAVFARESRTEVSAGRNLGAEGDPLRNGTTKGWLGGGETPAECHVGYSLDPGGLFPRSGATSLRDADRSAGRFHRKRRFDGDMPLSRFSRDGARTKANIYRSRALQQVSRAPAVVFRTARRR